MAEVIGVVASGVSIAQLAGSIASSIIKLKGFWNQMNDAPAEISHLLRQLNSFNLILQHMQHDQSEQGIPELSGQNLCMRRSLELCGECADELSTLVNHLDAKLRGKKGIRKKIGSANVVINKEDIRNLERRLDSAMQMLSLSYQFHTSAMIQLQPEIILMRLKDHFTTSNILQAQTHETDPQEEDKSQERTNNLVVKQYDVWMSSTPWIRFLLGQFEFQHSQLIRRGRPQENIQAKYRLPELLSSYQLAFSAVRPLSRWWFTFECHRTLPEDNPFIKAVTNGDVAVVQTLLAEKKGYVTDRTFTYWGGGYTPLHIAATNGDPEMCKLLISAGANLLDVNSTLETPLETALFLGGVSSFTSTGNLLETCRTLISAGADEILIGDTEILTQFNGPLSVFRYCQQQMYPSFHTMSALSRLEYVVTMASRQCAWHNYAFILEDLLIGGDSIDYEVINLANESGQVLLSRLIITWTFGQHLWDDKENELLDSTLSPQILDKLRDVEPTRRSSLGFEILLCKLISAGLSVRRVIEGKTPLGTILFEYTNYRLVGKHADSAVEELADTVLGWLKMLLQCGIDIHEYGSWEEVHFLDRDFNFRLYCDGVEEWWTEPEFQVRLIKFDYGSRLEDWKFWFSQPTDPFAGVFWAMVEGGNNEKQSPMPGAWSEDF